MTVGGIDNINLDVSVLDGDFVLVASRWNSGIVENLVEAACDTLLARGIEANRVRVIRVPGAFEIPLVCKKIIEKGGVTAVLAIGVVIRGDTPHFEYVAGGCTNGIVEISLQTGIPIAFCILTVEDIEQAIERSRPDDGNKGVEAALTALEMACLIKEIG